MTRGKNLVFKSMSDVKYKFLSELCHRHLLSKFHQANISIKDCQDFSNSLRASNLERKSWKHESLLRYVNLSYDLFILCTQTARIFNALHSHTMLRCGQGDIETLGDTERVRHRVIVTRDGATQQSSLLLSLLTLIMPPPRGLHQTSDAWYWPDTKCGHTGPGCQGRIRVTPKPASSEQRIMILKLLNLLTTSSTQSVMVNSTIHRLRQNNKLNAIIKQFYVVWIEPMLSKWCEELTVIPGQVSVWTRCHEGAGRAPGNQVTTRQRDKGRGPRAHRVMSAAPYDGLLSANKEGFSSHLRPKTRSRQLCIPVWSAGNCN